MLHPINEWIHKNHQKYDINSNIQVVDYHSLALIPVSQMLFTCV